MQKGKSRAEKKGNQNAEKIIVQNLLQKKSKKRSGNYSCAKNGMGTADIAAGLNINKGTKSDKMSNSAGAPEKKDTACCIPPHLQCLILLDGTFNPGLHPPSEDMPPACLRLFQNLCPFRALLLRLKYGNLTRSFLRIGKSPIQMLKKNGSFVKLWDTGKNFSSLISAGFSLKNDLFPFFIQLREIIT